MLSHVPTGSSQGRPISWTQGLKGKNACWVKRWWLKRVAEPGEKRWLWPRQARPQQSPCRDGSSFSVPADTEEKDSTPRLGTWAPETLSWAVSTHRAQSEPRLPVCT